MAIETTVNTIADLDSAVPTGAEQKSDGDNHLRNIKKALRQSFPGFDGAVIVSGVDGGVVNAYTLSPNTALPSYSPRMLAVFTPTIANTGAATLNISGLGVKPLRAVDGTELKSGDLPAGRQVLVMYDGTQFRLPYVTKNQIDQIVVSGTVPGVNLAANAGKFFTTDGTSGGWASVNLQVEPGAATVNKGASGTTAQVVNFLENGVPSEGQTITATGNFNLSASGFPAGRIGGVLLRAINWGAFSGGITSSGITWIKADGTKTTTFASTGYTLQAAGESMLVLFSYGDGTVYGKAA